MDKESRNIYRNARIASGMTQERWAEHLGISPDSVRRYEAGDMLPSDDIVLAMAEVSGQLILPYWHLSRKSRIAGAILPELEEQPGLPEAVLALLIQIEDFKSEQLPALMRIAADGKVSEDEVAAYRAAVAEIMELIRRAYACGYAKE